MKSARQPFAGLTQSMAAKNIRNFISNEDDEDEEALRLAALESLRVKGLPPPPLVQPAQPSVVPPNQVQSVVSFFFLLAMKIMLFFSGFPETYGKPEFNFHHSS